MRIYEIWREARETRSIQVNAVINGLLELGLATFTHLPNPTRNALFSRRTVKEDLKLQSTLEPRIRRIAGRFRSDAKLDIRLPRPVKDAIRSQAQCAHVSMSDIVRRSYIEET